MTPGQFIKRHKANLIFVLVLFFLFMAYRYPHSIQKGPFGIHTWRQSDCYSFALNYYEEGHKFFQPAINWSGSPGNGKTVSEFPIIYYFVSFMWKIFGKHDFIFRGINLLIVFTGLYYLFKFVREFLEDDFWAYYIPILLFTSPVLVFYSNNYLMNAPALGMVLIGLYQYWRYYKYGRIGKLYVSMLFFLLAGLLKMTALILYLSLFIFHFLNFFPWFRNKISLGKQLKLQEMIPFFLVLTGITSWLVWTDAYNSKYISGGFLRGILPIWQTSLGEALDLGTSLYTNLLPAFYNITGLAVILGLFLWITLKRKAANPHLMSIASLVIAACLAFILLFYKAFSVHDYYLINLLISIPLIAVLFLDYLKRNNISLFYSRHFRILSAIALFWLLYGTVVIQRANYDRTDTFVRHTIILSRTEKDTWQYFQDIHRMDYEVFETITPYLRDIGIKRTDKVISIPDGTATVTLTLMDQKGYTDFGFNNLQGGDRISHFIQEGAKYLIISESSLAGQEYLVPYTQNKIGQYKEVSIYSLSD